MSVIGHTDLEVSPLCLGGNVFGWTADEAASIRILDHYVDHGGNFVDTADSYSEWVEGNHGGESETIIGGWFSRRRIRDEIVVATKVGQAPGRTGLAPANVRAAAEASLRRLGIDHIDLYYAHEDDPTTPLAETLAAFDDLVTSGKVRYIAASNYSAPRLTAALETARADGYHSFVALQEHYNLVHRTPYESDLGVMSSQVVQPGDGWDLPDG